MTDERYRNSDQRLMEFLAYCMSHQKVVVLRATKVGLERTDEQIARELCGISGKRMAMEFMNGNSALIGDFIDNVKHCGDAGIGFSITAIHRHMQKRNKDFRFKTG